MTGDDDTADGLQQEILQKTVREVADGRGADTQPCVICLEQISELAQARPCGHQNFDFLCLTSWLEQQATCPLCKSGVKAVLYGFDDAAGPREYTLKQAEKAAPAPATRPRPASASAGHLHRLHPPILRDRRRLRRQGYRHGSGQAEGQSFDTAIARRRYVYKHRLFSCRVGSNRMSQYRELSAQLFNKDATLVQRARLWIRRELQVFTFLYPASGDTTDIEAEAPNSARDRRSSNAEFLLEYIISILRTVDIKAASGAAEELLQEFLGRDNARLFLHELHAFLRSPYINLRDWDAAVQYDEPVALREERRAPRQKAETTAG
ncbi:hypothetical protein KEM52_001846 [Ascosphaera acerosa]|nr:hypothetical protein KEM52_001846 [Ascosphaera acerosa]